MDNTQYATPWERPDVAMIMSIMNCRVVNVQQVDVVTVQTEGGMGEYGRGEI